jgi:hypothetical protein
VIQDHLILKAIRGFNEASRGRFGPASLLELSLTVGGLTGKCPSKSALSVRVRKLIERGWLEGIVSNTRGVIPLTLRPTDTGLALMELLEQKNASLEANRTTGS